MATYKYEQSLGYNNAEGYVKYNVSIPHGQTVFAGDAITISGVAKNTAESFTSIMILLITSMRATGNTVGATMLPNEQRIMVRDLNGVKNKEVEFSATIIMPTIARGDSYQYYDNDTVVTGTVANGIPIGLWFHIGTWSQTGWLETWKYAAERCNPTIAKFEIQRGAYGSTNDEGINALLSLKLNLDDTARFSSMTLKLYYAENSEATTVSDYINLTAYIDTLLVGVTNDSTLITKTFANTSAWSFLLVFGDGYESVQVPDSISKSFANVHLSGLEEGGVCFGGFSKSSSAGRAMFESHYPALLYGGIEQIGVKNEDGSLWEELTPESGIITPGTYGDALYIRKIENKCIIKGTVMVKPGSDSVIIANLPEEYKPICTAFRLNACQGARIARVAVHGTEGDYYGNLVLEWVYSIGGDRYTSDTIWVECSIEYWIDGGES